MTESLDHLWAGWRSTYIESVTEGSGGAPSDRSADEDGSLFERILRLSDEEGYVVHRGTRCSVLLNAYPYTSGHVLVLPDQATADLDELDADTFAELFFLVRQSVTAIRRAYRCDGVNVGLNLGSAAGAGVPEHLHVHCLPRWAGDTNFMTSVAETRVMPEPLGRSWEKLRESWPA
jgi:diadenosine tetraphosphate (Ap4A) HIT family hydrolase